MSFYVEPLYDINQLPESTKFGSLYSHCQLLQSSERAFSSAIFLVEILKLKKLMRSWFLVLRLAFKTTSKWKTFFLNINLKLIQLSSQCKSTTPRPKNVKPNLTSNDDNFFFDAKLSQKNNPLCVSFKKYAQKFKAGRRLVLRPQKIG